MVRAMKCTILYSDFVNVVVGYLLYTDIQTVFVVVYVIKKNNIGNVMVVGLM